MTLRRLRCTYTIKVAGIVSVSHTNFSGECVLGDALPTSARCCQKFLKRREAGKPPELGDSAMVMHSVVILLLISAWAN